MDLKTSARHRHRATAACVHCRKARIRCERRQGENDPCVNCAENQLDCVFDQKDGRKSRGSAKAVETVLMERIRSLETQLKEQQSVVNETSTSPSARSEATEQPPPYASLTANPSDDGDNDTLEDESQTSPEQAMSVMTKLIPSSIRFDMSSGRVRYFGSTTHMNVLSRLNSNNPSNNHIRPPQSNATGTAAIGGHWPIGLIVRDLAPTTHDYLLDLFWSLHNSIVHLVHPETFRRDQERGGHEFYSTFLHLTMLATGFRYADKTREDVRRLALPHGHATSTLHDKAKALAKMEMDRPGGIPSIQALQLLGGLEFCCGNDDVGWLFTGMCFRMVFDAGLHVDPASLGLPERDARIRHMVLWACMTTDRLWSLYLGRPLTIKTSDIAPACLCFDFGRLILCKSSWHEKKSVTEIYEALLRLMEVVSQLCDLRGPRPPKPTEMYFRLAAVDQQLRDWHAELPVHLQWSVERHDTMPLPYYLLHSQYRAALILLHRPYVQYCTGTEPSLNSSTNNHHFNGLSRTTCAESAKTIAVIFELYRSRFDLTQVYGTAVQHAGTSATALMGEIFLEADPVERRGLLERLASLRVSMSLMARNYQPARHMLSVFDQFIRSVQGSIGTVSGSNKAKSKGQQFPTQPQTGLATGSNTVTGMSEALLDASQLPSSSSSSSQQYLDSDAFQSAWASSSRKRARIDGSFIFTPTNHGTQSPSGLPFLPSSFLEGLGVDDSLFGDMAGMSDLNFQWDCPGGSVG